MCSSLLLEENFLAGPCFRTEGSQSLGQGWDSVLIGHRFLVKEVYLLSLWARAEPETQGMASVYRALIMRRWFYSHLEPLLGLP